MPIITGKYYYYYYYYYTPTFAKE